MHLVIAPAALIYLPVVSLEYTLAFPDAFPMFALVLVPGEIESEAKSISGALVEHALIAESIFEKHITYAVHLALCINLTEVYIAIIDTLDSLNPLNYLL